MSLLALLLRLLLDPPSLRVIVAPPGSIVLRVPPHVWVPDWRGGWVVPERAHEVRA